MARWIFRADKRSTSSSPSTTHPVQSSYRFLSFYVNEVDNFHKFTSTCKNFLTSVLTDGFRISNIFWSFLGTASVTSEMKFSLACQCFQLVRIKTCVVFFLYAYSNYGSRERFFFKVHEGPSKAVADALSLTILENLNINFKKGLFLIDIFSSALYEFCCCSLIYMEEALWRNSESRTRRSSTPGPCR